MNLENYLLINMPNIRTSTAAEIKPPKFLHWWTFFSYSESCKTSCSCKIQYLLGLWSPFTPSCWFLRYSSNKLRFSCFLGTWSRMPRFFYVFFLFPSHLYSSSFLFRHSLRHLNLYFSNSIKSSVDRKGGVGGSGWTPSSHKNAKRNFWSIPVQNYYPAKRCIKACIFVFVVASFL